MAQPTQRSQTAALVQYGGQLILAGRFASGAQLPVQLHVLVQAGKVPTPAWAEESRAIPLARCGNCVAHAGYATRILAPLAHLTSGSGGAGSKAGPPAAAAAEPPKSGGRLVEDAAGHLVWRPTTPLQAKQASQLGPLMPAQTPLLADLQPLQAVKVCAERQPDQAP